MMRRLIMLLLCSLLLFTVGCDFGSDNNSKRDIILYSTLEPKFTEELLAVYNEKNKKKKNFQAVKAIYELDKGPKPDLIIASTLLLANLKQEGKLQPSTCNAANNIPFDYKYGIHFSDC